MASNLRFDIAAPPPPRGGAALHRAHRAILALLVLAPAGIFMPGRCPGAPAPPSSAPAAPAAPQPGAPAFTPAQMEALLDSARPADAEAAARVLLRDAERVNGAESTEAAWALYLLAESMRRGGKESDPEGRAAAERALRINEALLGPEAPATLRCMTSLALIHYAQYETADAIRLLARVADILERTQGLEHPALARTLMLLAGAEDRAGNDSAAVRLVERAIRIQRAGRPPVVPDLAQSLNVLASIYYTQGDPVAAAPVYEEALALFEQAYGPSHPQVAQCLHNLGAACGEIGDYATSRAYLERALATRRETLGPNHPLVASTLGGLGSVSEDAGDLRAARSYYNEALRIQEQTLGSDHGDVAWTVMQLGRIDVKERRFADARRRLERALEIQERTRGPDTLDVAWNLKAMASVLEAEGDRAGAERSFERALSIVDRSFSPLHPDRIRVLDEYAGFLARAGDSTRALDLALQSAEARSGQMRQAVRGLSERQALLYLSFGTQGLDLATSLVARGAGGSAGASLVWDAILRSRTLVLDEMASRQRIAAAAAADSELAATWRTVGAARRRYATLLVRGPGEEDGARSAAALGRAREEMERGERDLSVRCASFRKEESRARIGLADVVESLPPQAALVAFTLGGPGRSRAYTALMIATSSEPPRVVSLGSARTIDASIERWLSEIVRSPAAERGPEASRAERACRRAGDDARRRFWDPIARRLGPVSRVYLVPDGALCSLNFAALPAGPGEYLADSGPLFHVLTSERDLVPTGRETPAGSGLLALGGPSYDEQAIMPDGQAGGTSGRATSARRSVGPAGGARPECADFRTVRFATLPAAAHEAEDVARMWADSSAVIVLTGSRASQSGLEQLAPGRRVVHLATHGFFLDGSHCVPGVARRGIGGIRSKGAAGPPEATSPSAMTSGRPVAPGSPLRLSGLALAGANRRSETGPGEDDGILTAEEVASIDLSGVEWAVLSACETGAGSVEPSEGVVGLRRAFQIAGARTVIMSLWDVEDRATSQWMKALYEARFRRGLDTGEAVREAGRSVLRERRAQGRSTHPFYWAGFVAAGDWR